MFCFSTAAILVLIRAYLKYLEKKDRQSGKIVNENEYRLTGLLFLSIKGILAKIKSMLNFSHRRKAH